MSTECSTSTSLDCSTSTSNECSSLSTTNLRSADNDNVQIVRVKDHVGYYIVDDDGNRTWYPDDDIGDKPLEGCEFVSIDQAYAFYKDYGKRAGFDVRKGGHYKPKAGEDPNLKWFLCSKEGKNPEPAADKSKDVISDVSEITTDENVIVKQTRNRGSVRCGCLAKIRIKKYEGNLYRVYTFIEGHNHPLVAEKDMIYMKSLRDLGYTKQHFLFQASNANFGPSTGFRLLKQICGGFDRVGATVVDCKNQKKKMNLFIGDRDAQMAVEKLLSKKLHSLGFYVNYKLGDDDKLVGLFWADEQAIRDYAVFGDIVSFDATFRSNKYKMVFVPFTGINHHNRCITFASGLLSDETVSAYKWLLEEFKNDFGKDPNVVITDQDPSMKIAIPECFPNTRHRLCMWHIMQKLVTKVGTAICNKTDFKRHDNKWLQDMFDIRESLIPAFLRDELMAGLMHTTSRSESENHFFGKWTSPHLTLVEFLSHYDMAIEYQRYIERKNDHDSRYKNLKLKTDLQMEKEASTFYTQTVFFDVQDEIYASYSHCMSVNVVQVDNAEKYSIRDMQAENRIKGDNNFVVYQVDFCKSKMEIECSCKHYEAYGLLCRHIFYVLRMNNIKEFPRKYLNKRWLKNDKPFNSAVRRIVGGSYSILESEVFDLYEIFESTIDRLVHDMDTLKIYKEQMKDLLNKAKIDVLTVPKMNSKDVFSAMLGVKEPTAKTIGNPDQSSNKGTGVHSRWKSKAEIE
ncbi:FAR1-related sequence 5-like protein [Tanacetum coccineum]|uniref:FAR1-related sequence 5-like protein n=1 Tax=Tanacetum coccineum TaxID=301880 RepID=A0ABQ5GX78_9ASTR